MRGKRDTSHVRRDPPLCFYGTLASSVIALAALACSTMCSPPSANARQSPSSSDAWQNLITASANGDVEAIRKSAPVVSPALLGSALRIAAMYGQEDAVAELLARDADPNARTENGVTPLASVLQRDDGDCIAAELIDAGADVNAADAVGRTVLMDAVAAGRASLVKLLLAAGADVHAVDARGRTAVDAAYERGDPELIRRLSRCEDYSRKTPGENVHRMATVSEDALP